MIANIRYDIDQGKQNRKQQKKIAIKSKWETEVMKN